MNEYKPITGELRNSMTYDITTALDGVSTASIGIGAFCDLCDAIDSVHAALEAEHEKAMIRAGQLLDGAEKERDYNYANWQECKQKVLQGNITFDELNARIECLEDELSHCIELPKDADGEYIRIGDMMECLLDGAKKVLRVGYMTYRPDGWHIALTIEENFRFQSYTPKELRYHHAPTVEDVLREFAGECLTYATCVEDHEVTDAIERFAAKLRMAGDAE